MDTNQNQNENDVIAQGVGQVLGELLGAFVVIVNAMRKQPGFDDEKFRAELQGVLDQKSLSKLQEHAVQLLVQSRVDQA